MLYYDDRKLQLTPLLLDDDAEEEVAFIVADLIDRLTAALPEAELRERRQYDRLHPIAEGELQSFAGVDALVPGLGRFDPPVEDADDSDLQLLRRR